MAELPTLKDTILRVLKSGRVFGVGRGLLEDPEADNNLTDTDRAFLMKWLPLAEDRRWQEIVVGAGHPPAVYPHYTFPFLVRFALRVNREAESARFGKDLILEARRQRHRERLEHAECALKLARYLRLRKENQEVAAWFGDETSFLGDLIASLEAAANVLAQMAGSPPTKAKVLPRQDRKGERTGLRKRRLFITSMSYILTTYYDQKADDFFHVERLRYSPGSNSPT
jgi:hypothetical protein